MDYKLVDRKTADEIDDSMGLKMISIRLPKYLLEELKLISDYRSVPYQALIRECVRTYVGKEIRKVAKEVSERVKATKELREMKP